MTPFFNITGLPENACRVPHALKSGLQASAA
jgi:hypothetical protein